MDLREKTLLIITGILGFLGVALGAFGSHILEDKLTEDLYDSYRTGILYHLIHSAAALAVIISGKIHFYRTAIFFMIGVILFSFSLYIYSITNISVFALITPFGGISFLIGWILLIVSAIRTNKIIDDTLS